MKFNVLSTYLVGVAMYGNDERNCINTKGVVKARIPTKLPPIIPKTALFLCVDLVIDIVGLLLFKYSKDNYFLMHHTLKT